MAQSGEELLPETQPVKVSSLHLQGDENVVEPKVQEPEKEDASKRKLGKALEDESLAQHETRPLKALPLHLQSDENVAEEPEKEDESTRKLGKALEDESTAQHETQPLKASPLDSQGDENVAEEPQKEDESKRNVVEDADEMDHSRKLLVQEKVGVGVKLGDVTESQFRESKQDEDGEANVAYSTKDSEDEVAAYDAVDDGKVQANDVDVVVLETQPPETQTQTLVVEPKQDESNVGNSDKEADENSKGVVLNLEEKVGVNTVDNANIPDEVIDQFAQEENENGALENGAMAEYELNKEEIAAAEASSSGN